MIRDSSVMMYRPLYLCTAPCTAAGVCGDDSRGGRSPRGRKHRPRADVGEGAVPRGQCHTVQFHKVRAGCRRAGCRQCLRGRELSCFPGSEAPLPHAFALATTGWSLAASMLLAIWLRVAPATTDPAFLCAPTPSSPPPSLPPAGLPLASMTRVMWSYRTCHLLMHASDLTRGRWRYANGYFWDPGHTTSPEEAGERKGHAGDIDRIC